MKGRKPTVLNKLNVLKEKCSENKLYRSTRIAELLGLKIENTRRYLRLMVNLGFVVERRYYRIKYYRILTTSRIFFGKEIPVSQSSTQEAKNKEVIDDVG